MLKVDTNTVAFLLHLLQICLESLNGVDGLSSKLLALLFLILQQFQSFVTLRREGLYILGLCFQLIFTLLDLVLGILEHVEMSNKLIVELLIQKLELRQLISCRCQLTLKVLAFRIAHLSHSCAATSARYGSHMVA